MLCFLKMKKQLLSFDFWGRIFVIIKSFISKGSILHLSSYYLLVFLFFFLVTYHVLIFSSHIPCINSLLKNIKMPSLHGAIPNFYFFLSFPLPKSEIIHKNLSTPCLDFFDSFTKLYFRLQHLGIYIFIIHLFGKYELIAC